MFDFNRMAEIAARVDTFTTDVDSRLEQLSNQQKMVSGLLALLILHREMSGPIRLASETHDLLIGICQQSLGHTISVPGVNPLSNFGDDENDRMPWQTK